MFGSDNTILVYQRWRILLDGTLASVSTSFASISTFLKKNRRPSELIHQNLVNHNLGLSLMSDQVQNMLSYQAYFYMRV